MHLFLKRYLNHQRIIKPLAAIILVVVGFFFFKGLPVTENPQHRIDSLVSINSIELKTMIVITTKDQSIGLSQHEFLNKDEAMLFPLNPPRKSAFWMKDMNFPIDIFWLNENKEVIFIKENAQPSDYPETYGPSEVSSYVLETVSGFSEKYDLVIGSEFSWK